MRQAVAVVLLVASCGVLVALSTPRRVGDGVEYWAMADQMRLGRPPSVRAADLVRLRAEAASMGHGYDQSPLSFPLLVARDGTQDFPHFWLYPLVNVPALALTSAIGVHPNWAFTVTNIALLAMAFWIVARRVSITWAVLLLGSPIVWWIDKAHGDVFTVSLLSIACASWAAAPALAVLVLAAAAAQNPALAPVWAMSAAAATIALVRRRRPSLSIALGIAVSAGVVVLPLAYYRVRLGVWSPLVGYTRPGLPSLRTMASLLLDPNIGLVPNAPFLVLALIAGIALAARSRQDMERRMMDWLLPSAAVVVLLAAFAQSININHGATPGINRWTLWLTPWVLLVLVRRSAGAGVRFTPSWILPALAALNCLWSVWYFRPSLPEAYRYPTATAAWLWTHVPGWYAPAAEIFAERVSHREPPLLPVAWPGCTKALLVEGSWPITCPVAAPAPPVCLGRGQLCYATPDADGRDASFVSLGPASFPWAPTPPR